MTRPLFEPSTPRQVAGLSWGEDQLYRRPPIPSASAGSEYAWLSCTTGPTNPVAGTPHKIPWDAFLSTNTAVFDVTGTGSTNLDCKAEGSYIFEVKVLFTGVGLKAGALFGGTILSVDGSDGTWFTLTNSIVNTDVQGADTKSGIRDTLTAYISPGDAPRTAFVELWNFDAVNVPLNIGYLKAIYTPGANPLATIF